MEYAWGNKVPGLPWKDQVTTLKTPLNQIGNAFCPFLSGTSFVPCKVDLRRVWPQKAFSFTLASLRKRGSSDQLPQAFFASFPHNTRLCPVDTLRYYLKATRNLRPVFPSSKPDPLFVSYVKPHNPITAPTLSRWLRMVLKNAGIDTDIFKAHSVRGASKTVAVNKIFRLMMLWKWQIGLALVPSRSSTTSLFSRPIMLTLYYNDFQVALRHKMIMAN